MTRTERVAARVAAYAVDDVKTGRRARTGDELLVLAAVEFKGDARMGDGLKLARIYGAVRWMYTIHDHQNPGAV